MEEKIVYKITDEIAYQLGKFDFPAFYSCAIWKINQEPFPLIHFFEWGLSMGTPCDGNGNTLWNNFSLFGTLKTERIKQIRHKLLYIRGRLSSYSVTITDTNIKITWANSYDLRNFFVQCLDDVIKDKFSFLPKIKGESGRTYRQNPPDYKIYKTETIGTIPGTPSIELEANKEIVKYLTGIELPELEEENENN